MRTPAQILKESKVIAVVGLSPNPERESHAVARYLQQQGYRIIPVNPNAQEVLGERCYLSLDKVPEPVDVVDIFRRAEDVPPIVDQAIAIHAKAVWMQLGIVNQGAADKAAQAGLDVVMDRCTAVEHRLLRAQGRG
ncbi:MAG: CoA-binding protein [Dehalococcoidia bacterium]|nr:CoA-binding protein [Dehalococcoidia bacterium]